MTFTKAAQSITALANPTSTSWANTEHGVLVGHLGHRRNHVSLDESENGNTSSAACQLSGVTLSATGPGVCDVYASIATDTNYQAATSADVVVTFTKAVQSVAAVRESHPDELGQHEHGVLVGHLGNGIDHLHHRRWHQRPHLGSGVPARRHHGLGHRFGHL